MFSARFIVLQMAIHSDSAAFTVFHRGLVQSLVASVIEGRGERAALC